MTNMSLEIEGSIDEVVSVLRMLRTTGGPAAAGDADRSIEERAAGVGETAPAAEAQVMAVADEAHPGEWTETLARDFLAELKPTVRRMALHDWRADATGIHRNDLFQRAELTPMEIRSQQMRMGGALARFGRERGMALARPVAANSPLQSYFVDPDFAVVANSQMFGDGMPDQPPDGAGCP